MHLKVAVCVPTSGTCRTFFAHSLAALMAYGRGTYVQGDTLEFTLFVQETSVIHANRETLVKQALDWEATHVLFLDDDMVFSPQAVEILLGRRVDYVACNYPKRGFPITFTAVRMDGKGDLKTHKESTGLEEAGYTGFGVSLISAEVFKKTKKPWFLPLYLKANDMYTTEDNPFCERIKRAGFKVWVDHDASKLVGHVGSHTYSWDQWKPEEKKNG